jgi:pimeloyl-ACP methyl ester carboxylesterase
VPHQRLSARDESPDAVVLRRPEFEAVQRLNHRQTFRQGLRPGIEDYLLNVTDWGFRPEDVTAHVEYWQGELDPNVSAAAVRRLADRLPDCTLHLRPGEGHMAYVDAQDEIFATVVRAAAA